MAGYANLTTIPTLVESPFIIATIGGVTFGSYKGAGTYGGKIVTYPNYMESVTIQKVNGTVNTYSLNFSYQVEAGEDPNLLDKIFSTAANDRKIILQYGDWNAPSYIYKEEVCIITNLVSTLDMNSACIKYTLSATSDAIGLASMPFDFPAREAKPSDVMLEMLGSSKYGMDQVFRGMRNKTDIITNNLIATNDKKVKLVAQPQTTPLSYLNYLANSMIPYDTPDNASVNKSVYCLTVHDDVSNSFGGTYFKVTEISTNSRTIAATNTYEVDINYPGDHFVTEFTVNNEQSWSILYEYASNLKQEEYQYGIDDNGRLTTLNSPGIVRSPTTGSVSPTMSSWWTKMTSFPIEATLTIKGLTRPSILMTYVKVNVWFNGAIKHTSSGLYIVTKQVDSISRQGYKTTLTLLRVGGD